MNKSITAMDSQRSLEAECYLLLESSLKSIPFNLVISAILSIDLYYNAAPPFSIALWYSLIVLISVCRWFYSKFLLKERRYLADTTACLRKFSLLTLIMGLAWGAVYLIFLSHVSLIQEFIIILVLGGMSAGANASLSVFLPAYYAYVLPMFLPVIYFNFASLDLDRVILAVMFSLFIIMLLVTAKINARLFKQTFTLSSEKDQLITQLKSSNDLLERSIEEIRTISITDSLTGLYNRRHFITILQNEFNIARQSGYPLTLVLIDIDNFKYINDSFGHPFGDNFLVDVANSFKKSIQQDDDLIFRVGGDEFAIILSNQTLDESLSLCTNIQTRFKKNIKQDNVSLSMGVIYLSSYYSVDFEHLISIADNTLYEAKKQGKNTVISKKLIH